MFSRAVWPQHNAGVLDRAVGEEQRGADHTRAPVIKVTNHLLQPAGVQRHHVVVQQAQQIAGRTSRRDVVRDRVVEAWRAMRDDPHPFVGFQ